MPHAGNVALRRATIRRLVRGDRALSGDLAVHGPPSVDLGNTEEDCHYDPRESFFLLLLGLPPSERVAGIVWDITVIIAITTIAIALA